MIEQVLIFSLGVCVAALLMSVLLPAYGARGRRLARRELEMEMPLSIAEIVAERDQLRAEFATQQRRLEQRLDIMTTQTVERLHTITQQAQNIDMLKKALVRAGVEVPAFAATEVSSASDTPAAADLPGVSALPATPAPQLDAEEVALLRRAIQDVGQDVVRRLGSSSPTTAASQEPPVPQSA